MNLRFFWRTTVFIITFVFVYLAFPILIVPSSLPAIQAMFVEEIAIAISPQDIEISHLSTDSFSLTFTTNDPVTAVLFHGPDSLALNNTIIEATARTQHRFTVDYLQPNSTHFFKIAINDIVFTDDENHPYQATTLSSPEISSDQTDTAIYQLELPRTLSSQMQKLTTLKKLHRQGLNKILGNISPTD